MNQKFPTTRTKRVNIYRENDPPRLRADYLQIIVVTNKLLAFAERRFTSMFPTRRTA